MKLLLFLVLFFTLLGCATGEKFSGIEEGMSKAEVRKIMGKQDQIQKLQGGWTVYKYKNRLMSGFSWDKTDYYVLFNEKEIVHEYGHGAVDTRMSERMTALSIASQNASAERSKADAINNNANAIRQMNQMNQSSNKKKKTECRSNGMGGFVCEEK